MSTTTEPIKKKHDKKQIRSTSEVFLVGHLLSIISEEKIPTNKQNF